MSFIRFIASNNARDCAINNVNDSDMNVNTIAERTGNTTMILLLGDSNNATGKITAPDTDDTVKAWKDSTSTIITAQDPLEYISWNGNTSHAVFLGKSLSASTGNDVVIVPAAQGGSGFADDKWEAGGTLYTEAVQRFNDAYTASSNITEILLCVSIGANNVGTQSYAADLDSLVSRLRTDLSGASSTTPLFLTNVNKDYLISNGRAGIEALGTDLVNRVAYTYTLDMTSVRSNNDVLADNDKTHHYDMDKVANLIKNNINTAKNNSSVAGTQAVPQFFLTPTTVDNEDGTINIRVPYSAWYNPQPTSQRIDVYKADDASFTNETLVSQNSVSVGTTSYTYTLPTKDGKHYYGKFVGINANGTNEFRTSDTYDHALPVNTVAPVASGFVITGQTLSVTDGTWTGATSFTYQWKRAGVAISGATSSTYTVVPADEGNVITCDVTADGVNTVESNSLSNWSPHDESFLTWNDGADPATIHHTSNSILQWDDKSGNDNHAVPPSVAAQPTLQNVNEVLFGLGKGLLINNDPYLNQNSPFIAYVGKIDTSQSWQNVIASRGGEGSSAGWQLRQRGVNVDHHVLTLRGVGINPDPEPSSQLDKNVKHLATASRYSGTRSINHNGTEVQSDYTGSGSLTWNNGGSAIGCGSDNGTGINRVLLGHLNEVIVGNDISNTIRDKAEGYLAHKWGLTASLPSNHPYKTVAP